MSETKEGDGKGEERGRGEGGTKTRRLRTEREVKIDCFKSKRSDDCIYQQCVRRASRVNSNRCLKLSEIGLSFEPLDFSWSFDRRRAVEINSTTHFCQERATALSPHSCRDLYTFLGKEGKQKPGLNRTKSNDELALANSAGAFSFLFNPREDQPLSF